MKLITLAIAFSNVASFAVALVHPAFCGGAIVPTYSTYATHCLEELSKIADFARSYSNGFCRCTSANSVDGYAKDDIKQCAEEGYSTAVWSDDNCGGGCFKPVCRCGMLSYTCEGLSAK